MQRIAWKAYVKNIQEYKKRHDEIWPEMTEMLNRAGVHNYTIWNCGNELFGYMECSIDPQESMRIQRESPVQARWSKHMEGLLFFAEGEDAPAMLQNVFLHP